MQQENSILKVDINNLKGRYEELERQVSKLLGEIKGLKEENDRLKNSQLSYRYVYIGIPISQAWNCFSWGKITNN